MPQRDDLADFYRRYLDRCNDHRFDTMGEFVADDVTGTGSTDGLSGYISGQSSLIDAFPDYRWELQQIVIDGPWLAVRLYGSGTHTGAPFRTIPATGRFIRTQELAFYRIADDKIVESWGDLGSTVRDALVSGGSNDDPDGQPGLGHHGG
jgi:predicted ester cyclase